MTNTETMAKARAAKASGHTFLESSTANFTAEQKKDLERVSAYLPSALKIFYVAYSGKSKAAAIKAKCLECCNLDKTAVSNCTITGCPLWRVRPYQKGDNQ